MTTDTWHRAPTATHQARDLFGPYWAEIWQRRRHHQMPMRDADPAAWAWAVFRLDGNARSTVTEGHAPGPDEAKAAVGNWLTANTALAASWDQVWNVVVPVIALLRAPSGPEARDRLAQALTAAGFDVYENHAAAAPGTEPFISEDGVTESDPPPDGWPWPRASLSLPAASGTRPARDADGESSHDLDSQPAPARGTRRASTDRAFTESAAKADAAAAALQAIIEPGDQGGQP